MNKDFPSHFGMLYSLCAPDKRTREAEVSSSIEIWNMLNFEHSTLRKDLFF